MRHLGMIGTTYRRAAQADLQRYTLAVSDPGARRGLHQACGFRESVVLATCNRVEIMFVCDGEATVADCRRRIFAYMNATADLDGGEVIRRAARAFHAYEGDGAAEHLFSVTAALDSMNPGEAQIAGQVKEAFSVAVEHDLAGPQLRIVFEEAFSAAKRVRQSTRLGAGAISMVSLARSALQDRLQGGERRLIIVGVGPMSTQCAEMFAAVAGIRLVFVNRTVSKAAALAQRFGGEAIALDAFLQAPGHVDAMVTATSAPSPLFEAPFFAALPRIDPAPVLVDLSLQRDVDLGAALAAGARVYDIDRLKHMAEGHRQARQHEIAEARSLVDEALEAFRRRLIERETAPLVRALRARYEGAVEASLGELGDILRAAKVEATPQLDGWAQTLAGRLAHASTVGLKRLAFEHGMEAVETFLRGIEVPGPDQVDEEEEER